MPDTAARTGLQRSTNLIRALGSDAGSIWQYLTPDEIQRLSPALETEPVSQGAEADAVRQCADALKAHASELTGATSVWDQLERMRPRDLASLLSQESPQVLAVILTRLDTRQCADLISLLAPEKAAATLHRLYSLNPIHTATIATIETGLADMLSAGAKMSSGPDDRIAEILDQLDGPIEDRLLDDLETIETGLRARIEKMMFRFEDIRHLDPASIQTLLAHCDRHLLIGALMHAAPPVRSVIFANMTRRASELLRAEINAAEFTAAETSAARLKLVSLVRHLSRRGDILITRLHDHELVE